MVQADEDCYEWIGRDLPEVIRNTVAQASSQDSEASPSSAQPHWNYRSYGDIRGKVTWNRASRCWKLHMEDPKQDLSEYLAENDLTLTVGVGLRKSETQEERYKTYITACKVWNALDSSNKYRIKLRGESHVETINAGPFGTIVTGYVGLPPSISPGFQPSIL